MNEKNTDEDEKDDDRWIDEVPLPVWLRIL